MKKRFIPVAIVLTLCGSLLFSSCIGSFALTNKLLGWNQRVGSKFVNELVFFAFWILPVYEVSALADILVINSIEFWSGDNPVASTKKTVEGQDGCKYLVETSKMGYRIVDDQGLVSRFDYDAETQTWVLVTPTGSEYELLTFIDDSHVSMPAPDGSRTVVELSNTGVLAYEELVSTIGPLTAQQ